MRVGPLRALVCVCDKNNQNVNKIVYGYSGLKIAPIFLFQVINIVLCALSRQKILTVQIITDTQAHAHTHTKSNDDNNSY